MPHGELPCGTAAHGGRGPGPVRGPVRPGVRPPLSEAGPVRPPLGTGQTSCDNTARERKGERLGEEAGDLGRGRGKRKEKKMSGKFSDSRRIILRTKPIQIKSDEFEIRSNGIDSISDRESDRAKLIHANK